MLSIDLLTFSIIINLLTNHGVEEISVNVHHLGHEIERFDFEG